eukprot:TRINITY_DN7937_c0_g1_i6.p1 TRINITY_DN7937_c0_g1~~TRINITY_DN7937_c0_g1_i6.p1  ORF type:complete len:174 (+),score=66.01 TRINITY_DN7937_c0_g1_i6:120-641(+)
MGRRVRFMRSGPLYDALIKAGYKVEEDVYAKDNQAMVVEIPVSVGTNVRTVKEVTMWEQLELAAFLQENWADNQVSCTIQFDPETEGHMLMHALNYFQYRLKGISFLPRLKPNTHVYAQLPYEEITEELFNELSKGLRNIEMKPEKSEAAVDPKAENFCDGDKCLVDFGISAS